MQTKTLSERIEELEASDIADLVVEMFERIEELEEEVEEELQERKAYIVANPCAQCGGRINAMKCDAWAKKAKELEGKVEIANIALRQIKNLNPELPDNTRAFDNGYSVFRIAEAALEKLNKQGD